MWIVGSQIGTKIFVCIQRTFTDTINAPDKHALDGNTCHFFGYLLGFERNFVSSSGESCHLVKWSLETFQTDTGLLHFTIVHDDDPLVCLTSNPECA